MPNRALSAFSLVLAAVLAGVRKTNMRGHSFLAFLSAALAITAGAGCRSSSAQNSRVSPSVGVEAATQRSSADFVVRLDRQIWVAEPFGTDDVATTRFGVPDAEPFCGTRFRRLSPINGLFMARHCDQYITFLPLLPADTPEEVLRFVAEHEAFHNLVQFRFGKMRIDSVDAYSEELLPGYAPLDGLLRHWLSDSDELGCESYTAGVKGLPDTSLKLARRLLQTEAPAEYYAARKLDIPVGSARYRQIRSVIREKLFESRLEQLFANYGSDL
ncbi:hypothetical protein, partial [Silanimonas sp.]|uniref:hypothetical protein n=1 Tax=Silanimonas sp. TaxID=1929290 RepID=UPI0037CA1DE5